jgi:phosphonoacetaldehyde dehydrogenase
MKADEDRLLWRDESPRLLGTRAACARSMVVRDPYSGRDVGTVGLASAEQVAAAVEWASEHKPRLTRAERGAILRRTADLLRARADEAARLITSESGLSLKDTRHEVARVIDVLEFGAAEVLRDDGRVFAFDLSPSGRRRKGFTQREPLQGVIVAITPFNHPMSQVAHKVVPSIATNNRMIVKPSEKTPLSALYLADLLEEAGLQPGMLQIAIGDPDEVVPVLVTHPVVDLVTFTGGVENGKLVAAAAGYRRIVLELGGNDPLIVLDDADVERAAELAVQGSYRNSGQRCTAVKRILVQRGIVNHFTECLVATTQAWRWGDPTDPDVDMGTLIDGAAAARVQSAVRDAVSEGACVAIGDVREGASYAPTVLSHVRPSMRVVQRETFGPVSPVIVFDLVDEAIEIANGTKYGLSAGLCTNRMELVARFVDELKVGTVNVWEVPGFRTEISPFGGIKDSGLGHKEGIEEAMRCYTNQKLWTIPWP